MTKLTILMPAYNREKYITEAISSILKQSFADFKLIIINDGSTDATEDIVLSFNDKRIIYYKQENMGEYATTNKLLHLVDGEYATWVHSDDILPEKSLELRVEALDKNPKIDIVHGDIIKIDSEGDETGFYPAADDEASEILKHYCIEEKVRSKNKYYIHFSTFMFRWEVINKVGDFDDTLPFGGDLDWMMRSLQKCIFKKVTHVLYKYRRHNTTITQVSKERGVDTEKTTRMIQARYCKFISKS